MAGGKSPAPAFLSKLVFDSPACSYSLLTTGHSPATGFHPWLNLADYSHAALFAICSFLLSLFQTCMPLTLEISR